jgi:anti-sigma regulatory factor (Ser/Thr protein kinase)
VRFEERFSSAPESAAAVRRFVRRFAPDDVDLDLVVLLATELATNALMHARTPFEVAIDVDDRQVRVGVRDTDPTLPNVVDRGERAVGGRGLRMVDTAARAWGVDPSGTGKRVWFTVDRAGRT